MTAASAIPRRRFQPMYMQHRVWINQPTTDSQQEELDILIGRGWRVFVTHAMIDAEGDMAVIYVLVQDVELDDDDGS